MAEPDFDQIARTLTTALGFSGYGLATLQASIAEQLRQVWNARGAADQETLEAALAAQHEEIWRDVETHWVRKENIEDLAARANDAETRVAELTEQLRQVLEVDR